MSASTRVLMLSGAARCVLSSARLGLALVLLAIGVSGFGAAAAFAAAASPAQAPAASLEAHRSHLALFAFGAAGVAFAMFCVLFIGL